MTGTSDQHPDNYQASKYPSVFVTVDIPLFTLRHGVLCTLLIQRGDEPFKDHWAVPGGFIEPNEDAETAAWRELAEETGVGVDYSGVGDKTAHALRTGDPRFETEVSRNRLAQAHAKFHLEQLKTYSRPDRDPRHRIVSIAHVAFAPNLPDPTAGSDARDARWWAVEDLNLDGGTNPDAPALAFDHAEILTDALERVRSKLEYTTLALAFAEEPFTMGDIHRIYGAVWNQSPHRGNLTRKILKTPNAVVPTDQKGPADSAGGPRPLLFNRGTATMLNPPMMRTGNDPEAED